MLGKILPYVMVGYVQTIVFLLAARALFDVPFEGSWGAFFLGFNLFIVVNLALGFLISTAARNQMQAMQLSFFTILPSILLSGFMFPFAGMPGWAQFIGQGVPATHFLRITRAVMLKGGAGAGYPDGIRCAGADPLRHLGHRHAAVSADAGLGFFVSRRAGFSCLTARTACLSCFAARIALGMTLVAMPCAEPSAGSRSTAERDSAPSHRCPRVRPLPQRERVKGSSQTPRHSSVALMAFSPKIALLR